MKKFAAVLCVLALALSLFACAKTAGGENTSESLSVQDGAKTNEVSATDSAPAGQSTDAPAATDSAAPTQTGVDGSNVFFNENNTAYDADAVSVKPRYVRWEDGKLIAECFVINGCSVPVYNINVKGLSFANGSNDLASAGFGYLSDVVLQPYTNIVWTFEFGADTVTAYGADLSFLSCNYNVSFDH